MILPSCIAPVELKVWQPQVWDVPISNGEQHIRTSVAGDVVARQPLVNPPHLYPHLDYECLVLLIDIADAKHKEMYVCSRRPIWRFCGRIVFWLDELLETHMTRRGRGLH